MDIFRKRKQIDPAWVKCPLYKDTEKPMQQILGADYIYTSQSFEGWMRRSWAWWAGKVRGPCLPMAPKPKSVLPSYYVLCQSSKASPKHWVAWEFPGKRSRSHDVGWMRRDGSGYVTLQRRSLVHWPRRAMIFIYNGILYYSAIKRME